METAPRKRSLTMTKKKKKKKPQPKVLVLCSTLCLLLDPLLCLHQNQYTIMNTQGNGGSLLHLCSLTLVGDHRLPDTALATWMKGLAFYNAPLQVCVCVCVIARGFDTQTKSKHSKHTRPCTSTHKITQHLELSGIMPRWGLHRIFGPISEGAFPELVELSVDDACVLAVCTIWMSHTQRPRWQCGPYNIHT